MCVVCIYMNCIDIRINILRIYYVPQIRQNFRVESQGGVASTRCSYYMDIIIIYFGKIFAGSVSVSVRIFAFLSSRCAGRVSVL